MQKAYCLYFLVTLSLCQSLPAAPDHAIEDATARYQDGHGDKQFHAETFNTFSYHAEKDVPLALFYLGRMHQLGHGTDQNFKEALRLYRKALQIDPSLESAWFNVGELYETGGHGLSRDYNQAQTAYHRAARKLNDAEALFRLYAMAWDGKITISHKELRLYQKRAAELGHPIAAYSAGYQYFHGIRDRKDHEKAKYFFKLAHENGREHAAYDAGWYFENRKGDNKPDFVTAAMFYKLATEVENPRPWDYNALVNTSRKPEVVQHYGKETINTWKALERTANSKAKNQALEDLMQAKVLFDQGLLTECAALLKERFDSWSERHETNWNWEYMARIWWDAQTETGASNLEWGRFVFAWLADEIFSRSETFNNNDQSAIHTRIGVRTNLSGRLLSLGRFGLLRARTAEIKKHIGQFDGLDVDHIVKTHPIDNEYKVLSKESLPIFPQNHPERITIKNRPGNDLLAAYTIEAMEPLSQEALSLGNWEAALIYAAWIERWIQHIESTGQKPEFIYGGYLGDIKEMPWALRARVFVALGLADRAAEQYQASIDAGVKAYRSRALHRSYFHLANYLVDAGRAAEVNLVKLREVEEKMRGNNFAERHEWQFAKLALARVLAETEGFNSGKFIVEEILMEPEIDKLPLLRLEALLVASDMHMDAESYVGVEMWLGEALKWAREQGLLFEEIRVYEHYIRYLIAMGDYEGALQMQHRVIELIDSLNLTPRRPMAALRLAEIYALLGNRREAEALIAISSGPQDESILRRIRTALEKAEHVSAEQIQIDLQPLRIVSELLGESCDAIFVLSNISSSTALANITLSSTDFSIRSTQATKESLIIEISQGSGFERDFTFDVPEMNQFPIIIQAKNLQPNDNARMVKLALNNTSNRSSEWLVRNGETQASVSIIDATLIKDSPFYLIPVFHHINNTGGKAKEISLRTIASEPTRIECFDASGRLLFVDAEGNGSFEDRGDLVATDYIDRLAPLIQLNTGNTLFELRYQPLNLKSQSRVEVKIETRLTAPDANWETNVIDWLER